MNEKINFDQYVKSLIGPILVTGASGFIGANILEKILNIRNDVYGTIHQESSWRLANVSSKNVLFADLNNEESIQKVLREVKPRTIFDCVAYGAYSHQNEPDLIYTTNFLSKVKLIESLKEYNIAAYVHAGSSSEYGINGKNPKEDGPFYPNSNYSVSKLAFANYLYYLGKFHGFPCINLRLYAVYGKYEDTSRLIPQLVINGKIGQYPPLVDPKVSRDFIHVDDVVEAFIISATKMNPDFYGESVNIGTGINTSLYDLANLVKNYFNIEKSPEFGTMDSRAWDLNEWSADTSKVAAFYGWNAQIDLSAGLAKTESWINSLIDHDIRDFTNLSLSKKHHSISAIVACYKDVEAIPIMYERLTKTFKKLAIDYEIIFVNDCSPDESLNVIKNLSALDKKVIGVNHSRNFGSQMAFISGMEISTMNAVVLLDGDLQDPPELVENFFKKWTEGFDVVYGIRKKREMPRYLEFLYKKFYRVLSRFSYINIPHDAGDFSLIDKKAVDWILSFPERDLFLRGIRAYVGFNQVGVDYERPERMFGKSTNNFLKNIDWAKKGLFSYSNAPLSLLTSFGFLILLFSAAIAIITALLRIIDPNIAPRGFTTLQILILIFGSMNIFAIGLVGEYVGRIMLEVKQRPRLIRSSIVKHGKLVEFEK